MKTLIKLAALLPIVFIFIFTFVISSCKKDSVQTTAPIDPQQVLTGSTWIISETRFLQSNTMYYYLRGATSGNNANFDTESIKFNADKTGTYKAGGITYNVAWDWSNAAKTKISYTVSYSPSLTVYWEDLVITNTSIHYTEYYNRSGNNSLGVATRIKQ